MEGYNYDRNLRPIVSVKNTQENTASIGIIPRTVKLLFEEIRSASA